MRRYRERTPPLLPPRRREWKKGLVQVGLFIRTATGSTIESVSNDATTIGKEAAYALLHITVCKGCKDCEPVRIANRALNGAIEARAAAKSSKRGERVFPRPKGAR